MPYALGNAAFDESDSIILFQRPDFTGSNTFEVATEVPRFPSSFNDEVSSAIVRGGTWLLYRDFDFEGSGDVSILEPGEYPNSNALGISNNKLSSIRPLPTPSTVSILLFQDAGFKGKMVHLTGTTDDLTFIGFNNKASSAIVLAGTWRLYDKRKLKGEFFDLPPGRYPIAGGDNLLGSLKPIAL